MFKTPEMHVGEMGLLCAFCSCLSSSPLACLLHFPDTATDLPPPLWPRPCARCSSVGTVCPSDSPVYEVSQSTVLPPTVTGGQRRKGGGFGILMCCLVLPGAPHLPGEVLPDLWALCGLVLCNEPSSLIPLPSRPWWHVTLATAGGTSGMWTTPMETGAASPASIT